MVKFYSSAYSYDYSFSAVSLAYYLRYPNPYSTHVLSTDTIDRHYDAELQRLTTTRLHLKRSRLPSAVFNLLPRSLVGGDKNGESTSYILETSTVDMNEGWMKTESRNLEWTGVLSVIENQEYRRPTETSGHVTTPGDQFAQLATERTDVSTTVTFKSNIGETMRRRRARLAEASAEQDAASKPGFFRYWTTGSIQRSVELIGLRRAEGSQPKAKQGMQVVLERLRTGGLVGVLEGMRHDEDLMYSGRGETRAAPIDTKETSTVNIDYKE